MTPAVYACCDERRRAAVGQHATLNGIDFLEVVDDPAMPAAERQRTLRVTFVKPLANPLPFGAEQFRIDGGERIPSVRVLAVAAGADRTVVELRVAEPGDFSFYTLHLVRARDGDVALDGFDPVLSRVRFSFKAECPSPFDCRPVRECPPPPHGEPAIDYLAKDYASFRRLLLDRMSLLVPDLTERSPADVGVALVELLAYVGDQLSYAQDAVATEAYLGTARRRVSVRRHARLVDYRMHDGCNARAWVHVDVSDVTTLAPGTRLFTRLADAGTRITPDSPEYDAALRADPVVFETVGRVATKAERLAAGGAPPAASPVDLDPRCNRMRFYTWGDRSCCLPKGATRATLDGRYDMLRPGDVLVLAERVGPLTGAEADADPGKRHAVRLIAVRADATDPLGGRFAEPPTDDPVPVTEIVWHAEDALPFPLCLSATRDGTYLDHVSVALGNIVLADHGLTVETERLDPVPAGRRVRVHTDADRCHPDPPTDVPPRYRPRLRGGPLTHAARVTLARQAGSDAAASRGAYDPDGSATAALRWDMDAVYPAIVLADELGQPWLPERDLLSSDAGMRHFVVESENAASTALRFGDDDCGRRPNAGETFKATYRVGNGLAGNVGADSIAHVGTRDPALTAVTNPLPAAGGREPETIEEVRQRAPVAFRTQLRAVTLADYEDVARRHGDVQRAVARHRWTGSWYTVFLAIDRIGGAPVDAAFVAALRAYLERFRLAGRDVEIGGPQYVALDIGMRVCPDPSYLAVDVEAAVLAAFGAGTAPDGTRGVFHPDNFSFGDAVYLGPLYARAQSVPGVVSASFTTFERQGRPATSALDSGVLTLEWREIARLDNDPSFPERGRFTVELEDRA